MRAPPRFPRTGTGTAESPLVPLPSCPFSLLPQHQTLPDARAAHAWSPPAPSAVTFVSPETDCGLLPPLVWPLPSWPLADAPQHWIARPSTSAQACRAPATTWVAVVMFWTVSGTSSYPDVKPAPI